MRKSRWISLAVAFTILIGSSPYPAESQMCGVFAYHHTYWDAPDMQGNCPVNRVNVVGERSFDCDGTYTQWGQIGGCDVDSSYWYCGDCVPDP